QPRGRGERRASVPAAAQGRAGISAGRSAAARRARVLRRRPGLVARAVGVRGAAGQLRRHEAALSAAQLRLRLAAQPVQLRDSPLGLRDPGRSGGSPRRLDLVALAKLLTSPRAGALEPSLAPRMLIFPRVRSLIASALVVAAGLAACGGGERANPPASRTASTTPRPRGIDALLLRVPRAGGAARVVAYPSTDSTVWTASDEVPALDRDAGVIAAVDRRGAPLWIDLRLGGVSVATRKAVHGVVSNDGSTIYAIGTDGAVARFTPSGNW